MSVSSWVSDCEGVPASSTRAVNVNVPALVGVPVSSPVAASVRPGGGVPAGHRPRVRRRAVDRGERLPVRASPTVPSGRLVVVIVGGGTGAGATVIESACVSLCVALSVTLAVKGEVPAAVGVPVIAPVEALSDSPAGSAPDSSDHV